MHPVIQKNQASIQALCARLDVRRLAVFGSAARTGQAALAANDFDFLVEMDVSPTSSRARRWLQLADGLELLLGKPVDLASSTALRNPFFVESINQDKTPIYERA